MILVGMFYAFKKFNIAIKLPQSPDIKIEVMEIPKTQQIQRPPAPPKPAIPIESEDDDLLDDVTIEENVFEFNKADEALGKFFDSFVKCFAWAVTISA